VDQEKLIEALLLLLKEAKFEDESNQEKANQLIELFELETEETEEFNDSEEEFESSELDEILGGYMAREGEIKRVDLVNALRDYGMQVSEKVGGNGHYSVWAPTQQKNSIDFGKDKEKIPASSSIPAHDIIKNTTIDGILRDLKISKKEFFSNYLNTDKKRQKSLRRKQIH